MAEARREREESKWRAEATRRDAQARAEAAPTPPAAPTSIEHESQDPEPKPLTPKQQAVEDLKRARLCVSMAEQELKHIREVEKTTGSAAPASLTFAVGQRLLNCRSILAMASKQCKAKKFC